MRRFIPRKAMCRRGFFFTKNEVLKYFLKLVTQPRRRYHYSMSTGRRAFIIHGWDGYSEEAWMPWLKNELEQGGFTVIAPNMPQPDRPSIETWVPKLADIVGQPDEKTYLIGHSMGCQTILRYAAGLNRDQKIGGAVLVAPGFRWDGIEEEGEDVMAIVQPWLKTPIDVERVRQVIPNITAIMSDNDPYNALAYNKERLAEFHAKIIVEHNRGHYSADSGITELPAAREAILRTK